jgi:hypothetical protein
MRLTAIFYVLLLDFFVEEIIAAIAEIKLLSLFIKPKLET